MTTLQEYLNQKYPNNREQIKKIVTSETTELLEGGELDLSEFINLEEIEVDLNFLTTPLTRVNTSGLNHLKNLIFVEDKTQLTDEEKKLFEDLGIKDKTIQNINQQKVVKEIKRLVDEFANTNFTSKKINILFATDNFPQTKLDNGEGMNQINGNDWDIYLQLDRKDKQDNFAPRLVFWTLTHQLTAIKHESFDKDPLFWNNLLDESKWVLNNIEKIYQKDFESLLNPSTFPRELFETSQFLTVFFPNSQEGDKPTTSQVVIKSEIIDKTWQTLREELIIVTNQELNKVSTDEDKAKLWLKLTLEYNNQEWIIKANYHEESLLIKQIEELINATPLKLEVENLEQKQAQLPTVEELDKLTKQKQILDNYLKDALDADEYQKVVDQINQIN